MSDWGAGKTFKAEYIRTAIDIMSNMINDGEVSMELDSMGVGYIDLNHTTASLENFSNYMKHFSNRFGFSVLEVK